MKNYYDVLGVDEKATSAEITKAFKDLAKKHHPDRGGDKDKFQEINEAHDTLKNSQKRHDYDMLRKHGSGSFRQGEGFSFNSNDIFSEDIFDSFFSGFRNGDMDFGGRFNFNRNNVRQRAHTNKSVNVRISVSIKEIISPIEKTLSLKLPSGRNEIVSVKLPAGCQNGINLKYKGLGDDSDKNLPRGDLFVNVSVLDSDGFTRRGNDLYTDKIISCFEACRGHNFKIKTLDDKILKVRIPPGTQPGASICLKEQGMPVHTTLNIRGNLYVKIGIVIPKLDSKQLEKIKDL